MYGRKNKLPQILDSITNLPQTHFISYSSRFFTRFQQSVVHNPIWLNQDYSADILKQTKANLQDSIIQLRFQLKAIVKLENVVSTACRNIEIIFNNQMKLQKQL
ncbi:Hypothetical_protein [Hexamita inflata]|uniref:Hypothetical_protein n=1 Tax=Hexamita inflata TaxID=28002 RepID=A0ABP1L0U2_9EUKA